ncbi:MAG: hypothetical protein PHY16_00935 [Methylobacter sp.]|nr:hypothetical protein [Methylobacter sp.]
MTHFPYHHFKYGYKAAALEEQSAALQNKLKAKQEELELNFQAETFGFIPGIREIVSYGSI